MFKENIKFIDYDGNKRDEDHWFHLNPAKLTELQMSVPGGMKKYMDQQMQMQNGPEIMKLWKTIIKAAYGVKSADGRRFMQSDEIWNNFYETEAYNTLFMKLVKDETAAKAFAELLMPDVGDAADAAVLPSA